MKKKYSMVLMVLLLLAVTLGAMLIQGQHEQQLKTQGQKAPENTLVNPKPPDPRDLENLGMELFETKLPVLMIDTQKQQIVREEKRFVKVAVYDDPSGVNYIGGAPTAVLDGKLKLRGASSYHFDKPQYRLDFVNEKQTKEVAYDLGGLGADSEWVLNGPFLDRTLMRNYLMYKLSGQVMDWAPDCRYCELFLNGRYMGVYLILEPINEGASRLRISRLGLLSGATGYIVARDRVGLEKLPIDTYAQQHGLTGNELGIRYPSVKKITPAQEKWITEDVSKFEQALYGEDFDDPLIGYRKYIDTETFVDYFILNEFAMNYDAGNLSTYVYRELGSKMKPCVWDFNNGFDNYQWSPRSTEQFYVAENFWFQRLVQDEAFVNDVVSRYRELRQGPLSDENIQAILQQAQLEMGQGLDRNLVRWGYIYDHGLLKSQGGQTPRFEYSYQEAMDRLQTVIEKRLVFMDGHITDLYDLCIN